MFATDEIEKVSESEKSSKESVNDAEFWEEYRKTLNIEEFRSIKSENYAKNQYNSIVKNDAIRFSRDLLIGSCFSETEDISDFVYTTIMKALCCHSEINYYQGLHDIATVLYIIFQDLNAASAALSRICQSHLTIYTNTNEGDVSGFINSFTYLNILVYVNSPELHQFLEKSGVHYHFSLSWMVTLFLHSSQDFTIARFLLTRMIEEPDCYFSHYLASALLKKFESDIMSQNNDFGELHRYLMELPKRLSTQSQWQSVFENARSLMETLPSTEMLFKAANEGVPQHILQDFDNHLFHFPRMFSYLPFSYISSWNLLQKMSEFTAAQIFAALPILGSSIIFIMMIKMDSSSKITSSLFLT